MPQTRDPAMTTDTLTSMLPVEAIRLGLQADNWRQALHLAGEALVDTGSTTSAYTTEMITAVEQMGPYIVIAPGVALAHARPSPAVVEAGLAWITLSDPVAFGHQDNDPVRLVIAMAVPDKIGHVQALASLADLLSDPDRTSELMEHTDPEELHRAISRFESERAS
jgi:ascorbate PTS system EIIA or EIIAB component